MIILFVDQRIRRLNRNQIDGRLPAGRPRPRPIPTLHLDQVSCRIFSFSLTKITIIYNEHWYFQMILNLIANEIYVQLNNYYSAIVLFLRSSNLILLNREEIETKYAADALKERTPILGKNVLPYMLIVKTIFLRT